jgi:hypothetical protein
LRSTGRPGRCIWLHHNRRHNSFHFVECQFQRLLRSRGRGRDQFSRERFLLFKLFLLFSQRMHGP